MTRFNPVAEVADIDQTECPTFPSFLKTIKFYSKLLKTTIYKRKSQKIKFFFKTKIV